MICSYPWIGALTQLFFPSVSAAYASVKKRDLPMATISLNIVQRLGGPTMTTLCATFLGWSLRSGHSHLSLSSPFVAAFILLCLLHALLFAASLRLPLSIDKTTEISIGEEPKSLGMAE
jgi:hypothetical protein